MVLQHRESRCCPTSTNFRFVIKFTAPIITRRLRTSFLPPSALKVSHHPPIKEWKEEQSVDAKSFPFLKTEKSSQLYHETDTLLMYPRCRITLLLLLSWRKEAHKLPLDPVCSTTTTRSSRGGSPLRQTGCNANNRMMVLLHGVCSRCNDPTTLSLPGEEKAGRPIEYYWPSTLISECVIK